MWPAPYTIARLRDAFDEVAKEFPFPKGLTPKSHTSTTFPIDIGPTTTTTDIDTQVRAGVDTIREHCVTEKARFWYAKYDVAESDHPTWRISCSAHTVTGGETYPSSVKTLHGMAPKIVTDAVSRLDKGIDKMCAEFPVPKYVEREENGFVVLPKTAVRWNKGFVLGPASTEADANRSADAIVEGARATFRQHNVCPVQLEIHHFPEGDGSWLVHMSVYTVPTHSHTTQSML